MARHSRYDIDMDRRRIIRETDTFTNVGRVLSGTLAEIGMIPVERQQPELVALALRCAALIDDAESVAIAPLAFLQMACVLEALHGGADE